MSTATIAAPANPWRVCVWSDANYREVKRLHFHADELGKVLALPFPPGAVVREPIYEFTTFATQKSLKWFLRWRCPFKVGDGFDEDINQGLRPCTVLAIDDMGRMLYEYDMPNGRTFLRIDGRPVARNRLSRKWRNLLGEDL